MTNLPFFLKDRLTDAQIEKFKLFEDEELIFACREHWLPLTLKLCRELFVGLFMAIILGGLFFFVTRDMALVVSGFLLALLMGGIALARTLIHWSFHLYIATNKQIIEVHYTPLLAQATNSVLLDQIRCTEIDVNMFGFIPELIGIGNVEITFDRPTHKEMFVIKNIRSPHVIANLLSAQIHQTAPSVSKNQAQQPIWVKELKTNKYKFLGNQNYGYTTN